MKAMVLKSLCNLRDNHEPLELIELPQPVPNDKELLLKKFQHVVFVILN